MIQQQTCLLYTSRCVSETAEELYEGDTETKTEGVEGEAKVTYTVTYADGKEENRVVKTK